MVAALAAAMRQFGRKAASRRAVRATRQLQRLIDGMEALGFQFFLREMQAPIIVTFHSPGDPNYEFRRFYDACATRASSSTPAS